VVGNEELLRGEIPHRVGPYRSVKSRVTVPVTCRVWEFWLRNRGMRRRPSAIHILPYWGTCRSGKFAASHVDDIASGWRWRSPKGNLIGETGWPSAGRMREGALPSRTNQARVVSEILDLARREKIRVNLIEAYDQPWKRQLEGTVGGHWAIDDATRGKISAP
jgi:glucan 1,3-beta-glucosidase